MTPLNRILAAIVVLGLVVMLFEVLAGVIAAR